VIGLCGLSGVAHGLMVVAMTEHASDESKAIRCLAKAFAAAVTAKALYEFAFGTALFSHMGNVGTPIPACHLGGVLAGWAATAARFLEHGPLRAPAISSRLR
jgi:hypothetical protein